MTAPPMPSPGISGDRVGLHGVPPQRSISTLLRFAVGEIGLAAEVLADAGALVAAGRQDVVARAAVAIDPDGAGLQIRLHRPERAGEVAGEEAGAEAIGRVVGERERLLLRRRRSARSGPDRRSPRSRPARSALDAGEQRRRVEIAGAVDAVRRRAGTSAPCGDGGVDDARRCGRSGAPR